MPDINTRGKVEMHREGVNSMNGMLINIKPSQVSVCDLGPPLLIKVP